MFGCGPRVAVASIAALGGRRCSTKRSTAATPIGSATACARSETNRHYSAKRPFAGFLPASRLIGIGSIPLGLGLPDLREFTYLLKVGIIAAVGLTIVYAGLTYIGASFGGIELVAGAEKTDLLVKISIPSCRIDRFSGDHRH